MTNQFTTPEFADLLKQHGIEIDTIFVNYDNRVWASHLNHHDTYTLIATDTGSMVISSNIEVKPAYLLSQVLGWLPETLIENLKRTNTPSHRPDYLSYPMVSDIDEGKVIKIGYRSEYYGTKITPQPVEQLITQGLTEGWLTKEIIEQQIKQNQ